MDEYIDVSYKVTLTLPEGERIPSTEELQRALYQGLGINAVEAILVEES